MANKLIKYIILILIVVSSFTGCLPGESKDRRAIKIACGNNWKPFSYVNNEGNPEGILIDFWRAWGKTNGVNIEFKMTSWSNTLDMVKKGEADVHLGLFYNEDRSEYMDFSIPFMDMMTGIFVKNDVNAWHINDIKDIGIAVSQSNNARFYLQKNYPNVKLSVYTSNKDIMDRIKGGDIKALSVDYYKDLKNTALYYPELNEFNLLQTIYIKPLRVGVKKGNKELLTLIDNGIRKMSVNQLKEVQSKWQYITINLTRKSVINYFLGGSIIIIIILLINILFLKHRIKVNVKRLEESEQSYKSLVELSPDGIFLQCQDKIVFVNKAVTKILGEENSENLINKRFIEFVHPDYKDIVQKRFDDVKKSKTNFNILEQKIIKANGEVIHVGMSTNGITHRGKPATLTIIRDISERKKEEEKRRKIAEEEQRLLKETLEYERLKTELFSNISHEFRTPLNIILGSIQLLNRTYDKSRQGLNYEYYKKYSDIMKQNCYRQIRLINNLIDITRIDSGFLKMKFKNHNIVEVVENITLSVAAYIEIKEVNIIFDTDTEEKLISCDADNMERVILNLLSNAIKFTRPNDSIYVNVYDRDDKVCISVKDTGVGIPKEKQKIIFERFRQAQPLFHREREGSGIGLSLVKSIIELHGGRIYLNGEYELGSEFVIEIPANVEETEEWDLAKNPHCKEDKVEMINIEFSDIYGL
ncbi:MAG: transporter substrate-binding domain-containing protein [Anaeromicrobium sp.]|jgi:PAS domain S-box-containing protein|uniref:ATP-binding protein n=1 Tax=Anaeromicrobium sp. TaxID=1929132 RepID=UPI0025F89451|nr:transporter substrate-binding domain-containing protein [Anaeromicrobium sp.]MCT4592828.1 transporter substrate-binding domain-containing protein [Anaeromicrobium sp.]